MKFNLAGLCIGLALLAWPIVGVCQAVDWRGQVSGWLTLHDDRRTEAQIGLRALPAFFIKKSFGEKAVLDAEVSFNAYGTAASRESQGTTSDGQIEPYRLWVRFTTARFEARLGLQKINFGSALLLRPLMWFDRIDPNDPLQLTDGVTGLLGKYTFVGNANIWVWGLLGNREAKGWEYVPTKRNTPEFGGRFQVPFLSGETAFTFHHRLMDPAKSLSALPPAERGQVPENRYALDGKWDIGPGVWFEGVLIHQDFRTHPLRYQQSLNLGTDYTLGIGSGLHLIAEHLIFVSTKRMFGTGESTRFTGIALDYSLGLLDRIKGVVFRNWKTGDWYRFVTWQRTYDKWSFYAIGFWNPDRYQIYASQQGTNLFSGKGIQIMAVYNY